MAITGLYFSNRTPKSPPNTVVIHKVDTLYQSYDYLFSIPKERVKTIIREKLDTVIIIQNAYEKQIDTTIDSSYLRVNYYFPQDSFQINLKQKLREISIHDTVKTFVPMEIKDNSKSLVIVGAGGVAIGIILGILIGQK